MNAGNIDVHFRGYKCHNPYLQGGWVALVLGSNRCLDKEDSLKRQLIPFVYTISWSKRYEILLLVNSSLRQPSIFPAS